MALLVDRECEQVPVAEALTYRGRLGRGGGRGLEVRGGFVLEHDRYQQVALLDAFAPLALHQALGAAEPPARAAHLSATREEHTDPERAANRGHRLAGVRVRLMGSLEDAQVLLVAAGHEGGGGQELEVLPAERGCLVGGRESFVRVDPLAPPVGLTTQLELVDAIRQGCSSIPEGPARRLR